MGNHIPQDQRFAEVWDSLEPEIQEDLERLYYRLRVVKNEAQLNGVRNHVLEQAMQERFWTLWKRIGVETA